MLAAILSDEQEEKGELSSATEGDHLFRKTADIWREMSPDSSGETVTEPDKGWEKLRLRIRREGLNSDLESEGTGEPKGYRFTALLRIAAAIVIMAGAGYGLWHIMGNGEALTGKGITIVESGDVRNYELLLPDGTKVMLNSNSKISYPEAFGTESRELQLSGEALFDVAHSSSSDFTVFAGNAIVEVMGTAFNVNTRQEESDVEVLVTRGSVKLTKDRHEEAGVILEAGDFGSIRGAETIKSSNVDRNYLAWNTDYLEYEGSMLSVVFRDLRRSYGIEVAFDDLTISEELITTVFENLTEEQIIQIICTTFDLTYSKKRGVYVLSR